MPNDHPEYENPPVIEVVFGISFEQLEDFRIHHIGLLWEMFKEEYPTVQEAPRLGLFPESLNLSELPLPRTWFINEADDELIQIQNDRFFFNWREREGERAYPRYKELLKNFRVNLDQFLGFLDEKELGPIKLIGCELRYINHFEEGKGWESPHEIGNLIPDFSWREEEGRFLAPPEGASWKVGWSLPEDLGNLSASLSFGTKTTDNSKIFVLELVAVGLGDEKSFDAVWHWFDVAHTYIVCGFADLTSPDAQKNLWGRVK